MSVKNTIFESQLRAIVRVLLEDSSLGPFMVNVNPVVDPSAALTDPANQNSKPHNRVELKVALTDMINSISDDQSEEVFDAVKKAIESSTEEEKDMKKNDKVEEIIRRKIRQMLGEAAGAYTDSGMSYSGPMTGARKAPEGNETCEVCQGDGEDEMGHACKECRGKGYVKSSKRGYEKGEEGLEKMAQKFGYSRPSGVRAFIGRTLGEFKKKFELNRDDPDALDILILQGINDYIEYLKSSGELTPADVQLLKDHPTILWSMPDAQEHVANYISQNS